MNVAVAGREGRFTARSVAEFKAEVLRWAARIGVRPTRLQIQHMTTKWASCSRTGRVCFSRDLVSEAPAFQEVVIVHELLHLLVPNHGKLFRSLMTAYVPAWESARGSRIKRVCGQSPQQSLEA